MEINIRKEKNYKKYKLRHFRRQEKIRIESTLEKLQYLTKKYTLIHLATYRRWKYSQKPIDIKKDKLRQEIYSYMNTFLYTKKETYWQTPIRLKTSPE